MRVVFVSLLLLVSANASGKEKHKHHHKAHSHGHAALDIAVDGQSIAISLEVPGDVIFGFEHQPKTEKQKTVVTTELDRLSEKTSELFTTPADAGCTLAEKSIKSDQTVDQKPKTSGHADVNARFTYKCTSDLKGKTLAIGLFKAWPRLKSVKMQVVGSAGQQGQTLKTDVADIKL